MFSFSQFLSEGSRSSKRNLRIIKSKKTGPSEISRRLRADYLRDERRAVVRGVKNYLEDPKRFETTHDILKSGGAQHFMHGTLIGADFAEKMGNFFKGERSKKYDRERDAIERKYPGSGNERNYMAALPKTYTLPYEGSENVVHRALASSDPKRERSLVKSVKRLQGINFEPTVTDSGEIITPGNDLAASVFTIHSPNYAFDPKKVKSRIKWRNFLKK
jgi:hypothetical protein